MKRYLIAADPGTGKTYQGVIVCMSTTDKGVPHIEETRIIKYNNCTEEQRQKYFEKSLADIAKNYKIKAIPDWILNLKHQFVPIQGDYEHSDGGGKRRGSYVSRSAYQKLKEENKKLLADIKNFVSGEFDPFMDTWAKWRKHLQEEDQFNQTLKEIAGAYKQEHPEEFPNLKKDEA